MKGPQFLLDKEFNVPVFAAEKQIYKCIGVEILGDNSLMKEYNILLSEIKGLNYSVPERIDVRISIPNEGKHALIRFFEIDDKTGNHEITKKSVEKSELTSFLNIKHLFYNIPKNM